MATRHVDIQPVPAPRSIRARGDQRATPKLDRRSLPLTVRRAVALLNAKAGELGMSASSLRAIRSTFLDAVRRALRNPDGSSPTNAEIQEVEIQAFVDVLHVLAREAAVERRHQSPGEHATRAARAVELITGERYDGERANCRMMPILPAWAPLADCLRLEHRGASGEIRFLAHCVMVAGGTEGAPAKMPPIEKLLEAATTVYGGNSRKAKTRLKNALTTYRRARRKLVMQRDVDRQAVEAAFAYVAPLPAGGATHLGVERDAYTLLEQKGCVPEEMKPEEMFRAIFAGLAGDYDQWLTETECGAGATAVTRENCLGTLLRLAGWLIRAGDIDVLVPALDEPTVVERKRLREIFPELHLDDLFVIGVQQNGAIDSLAARAAKRRGKKVEAIRRCLLVHLVEQEAPGSLSRSTVIGDVDPSSLVAAAGKPYFTDAIKGNCERIWTMTEPVWRDALMGGDAADQARWGIVRAQWGELAKAVKSRRSGRALPAQHRKLEKNKSKLIKTITLPQLVCVGAPLRCREISDLRERWEIARSKATAAGYPDPDAHPVVDDAWEDFAGALEAFLMLMIPTDDGLRKTQYVRGRPGCHFEIAVDIREGEPRGVAWLKTNWTADTKNDPAHLKNYETNPQGRTGRELRMGYVPPGLLWEFLSLVRPRRLVQSGAITSLAEYDLLTDLRASPWAFFPSPKKPSESQPGRPDKSRTDLSEKLGEELHHIARILRPDLPGWSEMQGNEEWRSLWAAHITRLLIASYWGGVRDEWEVAMYLTTDARKTLEQEYSIVAADIRELTGRDLTHWEHPHAYDKWMDQLYHDRALIDPLDDPDLPLPPHLRLKIEKMRKRTAAERRRLERSLRIRKPRPPRTGDA